MSKKYKILAGERGCNLYVPTGFPIETLNQIVDSDGVPAILKSWEVKPSLNQNPNTVIFSVVYDPRQTQETAVAAIETALDRHFAPPLPLSKGGTGNVWRMNEVDEFNDRKMQDAANALAMVNTEAFLRP